MAATVVVMNMLNQRNYAGYGPHNDEDPPGWLKILVAVLLAATCWGIFYAAFSAI